MVDYLVYRTVEWTVMLLVESLELMKVEMLEFQRDFELGHYLISLNYCLNFIL
jgi:hypothetical protein